MPNIEPIKNYIKAKEAFRGGTYKESLTNLAKALGAETITPAMETNLTEFFSDDTLASDVVLHLVLAESRRQTKRRDHETQS